MFISLFSMVILQYTVIVYLILFLLGAVLGALVNWYVDRYGWIERFRSPWRRSDKLQRVWFDFIPILGWFKLRRFGKNLHKLRESERAAGIDNKGFWIRPLFVELFAAIGLILLYYWEVEQAGLLPETNFSEPLETSIIRFAAHIFLFTLLLAASLTDLDDFIIPANLTIIGTIGGIFIVTIFPQVLLPATELYLDNKNKSHNTVERLTPYPVPLHFCSPDKIEILRNYNLRNLQTKDSTPQVIKISDSNFDSNSNSSRMIFCNKKLCRESVIQFLLITFLWLFWCFAMMDRIWYFRLSFRRALLLFFRNLYRSSATKYWLILSIFVPAALFIVIFFTSFLDSVNCHYLLSALIGLAAGMWLIWSVRLVAGFALGVEAMGFGDVILLGMIGVFAGWQSCIVIFFLAPFAGIIPSLIGMLLGHGRMIPYGPFLSFATLLLIIFWAIIWRTMEQILFQSSIQTAIAVQFLIILLGAMLIGWKKIKEKIIHQ
ncbi:MAG: A24 family peptidase [Planctomycetaceae bacterium]|jgi:prepilin signal peptidase PulO-like enzyme (type II secretory pathway)|nr:A24 family peptidase [Planctomycetaceae bacterium]